MRTTFSIGGTRRTSAPRGYLMLLALIFGSIFVTVLGALAGFAITQNHAEIHAAGTAKALALAEEGLEYYRWHLAHYPTDFTNGTGHAGPYTITENDPEGGVAGTASLAITNNSACGQALSVDIASTGAPSDGSRVSKTVVARYAQPSVAQYSYIVNDSVWAGADRVINGPYHSNGGIRMDGTTNAPVTSSLSSWLCTINFGCSPDTTKNGVFGSGPNSSFWSYPSPQVDFNAISANFTSLKSVAQSGTGKFYQRYSTGNSKSAAWGKGYHLVFNANGTVSVYRVSSATQLSETPVNPSSPTSERSLINNETFYETYTIPASCGLIFVEDNTWIEGVVSGKVTVVAANATTPSLTPNVYLRNNITYKSSDGSSGLTVISANDILIAPDSPNTMTLNGIFIAQGGAFGRNLYSCPSSYEPRSTLTIHGTTVSNIRTGTKWPGDCSNGADAGYETRIDSYDKTLSTNPPPFTPVISTDYQFVDWREQ